MLTSSPSPSPTIYPHGSPTRSFLPHHRHHYPSSHNQRSSSSNSNSSSTNNASAAPRFTQSSPLQRSLRSPPSSAVTARPATFPSTTPSTIRPAAVPHYTHAPLPRPTADAATQYSPPLLIAPSGRSNDYSNSDSNSSGLSTCARSASSERQRLAKPRREDPEPSSVTAMSLSTAPPTKASPPAPALEPKTPSKRPDRRSASIPQPTTDAPSGAPRPSVSGETSPKRIRPENPSVKLLPARYDLCHVKDLVVLIADMLNELVRFNDDIPLKDGRLTRFHSRAPPTISIPDYLSRLATHATLSPPILLSMVYYIDRLCSLYPAFIISSLTVHRFLIVAATVASKGLSDSFWTNSTYAKVGGVSLKELALLELEFLEKVGWRIVPRPEVLEDYYRSLVRRSGGFEIEGEGTEGPSTGCGEEVQEQGASVGTSVKSSDESAAASVRSSKIGRETEESPR